MVRDCLKFDIYVILMLFLNFRFKICVVTIPPGLRKEKEKKKKINSSGSLGFFIILSSLSFRSGLVNSLRTLAHEQNGFCSVDSTVVAGMYDVDSAAPAESVVSPGNAVTRALAVFDGS